MNLFLFVVGNVLFSFQMVFFFGIVSTYMDTSTKLLSDTGPVLLQSLLVNEVVGDVEPRYGNPGVIVKLPKFVDDALDAFESLLGDGAGTSVGI